MGIIKKTIQQVAKEYGGLARIAEARGKSQVHSSTQYPSFLKKIEDIEKCLKNLGYKITVEHITVGGGGKKENSIL